jgi:hypothetical protein
VEQFSSDLNAVVIKYSDQGLTVAEALGVIEVLKIDIWYNHTEKKDSPPTFDEWCKEDE